MTGRQLKAGNSGQDGDGDSDSVPPGKANPGQVLAIVCVGMVLANLDLFIVNVGLPNIAAEFHDGKLEHLSWILNAYTITYASLLVFFGRLAERYRRDWSFLLGIGMFTLASAACAAVNRAGGAPPALGLAAQALLNAAAWPGCQRSATGRATASATA